MEITQQIENILDKRLGRGVYDGKGHLQQIERNLENLRKIQERINQFDSLMETIRKEMKQEEGDYYRLLQSDPESLVRFSDVSCVEAQESVKRVIDELEKLKLRFNREALRIAFIGRERQGKSTFLKTISGLSDKVIPAYSGDSCTGAVSVIHNTQKPLEVVVNYYTVPEFLQIISDKLRRFFPSRTFALRKPQDIVGLQLPDTLEDAANGSLIAEYEKFKDAYVVHYGEYEDLIGAGVRTYTDEDVIAQHVAQYEEFTTEIPCSVKEVKTDGRVVYRMNYYKYVVVKDVNIYNHFEVPSMEKIELVDTIGIGSAADSASIKEEMYRVLREDCDAAIDLFRPDSIPNYPLEQTDLLDEISKRLAGRMPSKWIVYVINKVTQGPFKNDASVNKLMPKIRKIVEGYQEATRPVAWAQDVDGSNLEEVSILLMENLLKLLVENLDVLDGMLMTSASELAKEAYNKCLSLVKAANAVTSAGVGMSADLLSLFDEKLFKGLSEDFGYALNQLDDLGYAKDREKPCVRLEQEYSKIIGDLDLFIPEEEDLLRRFMTGAAVTPTHLFEECIEQMRNDIFAAFENVNTVVLTPLQEKVKTDLIEVLYNQGRMKKLPVSTGGEGPTVEWLREILENYVDENSYPYLHKALEFILDYQINIEGLVEYNVTRALYPIDRTRREFIPYQGAFSDVFEEKASIVWQELCNRIWPVSDGLKAWIGDFTLIPSHSFYSRVHKFHIKVMTDQGGVEDFRRFYRKNMGLIWSEEIMAAGKAERAFGDWTDRVKALQAEVVSENFKIN